MSYTPCCFRLPFRLATELTTFTLPPTSSTFCPPRPSQPLPPTLLFSAPLPPTPTYGSSGVPATRTPLPLLPISSPLALVSVSFLGTPLSTKGTGVSISARTACWSLGTSSSTSYPSPLPPPVHLMMTWTPSSRLVLRFARLLHPTPLLLQVLQSLTTRHTRLRHPISHHARPQRPRPRHARPQLHASSSPPGVPAMTSGPHARALSRRVIGLPPRRRDS
jgi:hypothetical protein